MSFEAFSASGLTAELAKIESKENDTACFMAGTLVATPDGEKPIESLNAGDLVLDVDGNAHQVKVRSQKTVVLANQPADSDLKPIEIKANAFGPGMPERDLRLSRENLVLVTGMWAELLLGASEGLVRVADLINDKSIRVCQEPSVLTYHAITCDARLALTFDGLAVECMAVADSNDADNLPFAPILNTQEAQVFAASALA